MSDTRAKIALSGIIATIVMVVGLFSFAPIVTGIQADSVSTTGSSMGITGHFTLVITDPDGFVKYYGQFDNAVQENTKECMIDVISTVAQGVDCTAAAAIVLGGSNAGGFAQNIGMAEPFVNTNGNSVVPFAETLVAGLRGNIAGAADNAVAVFSQTFTFGTDNFGTNPIGCVVDGIDADNLDECTVREIGLQTAGATLIARAGPTVAVPIAEAGDRIAATYTVTEA